MNTNRLIFRNRTSELINEMLTYSQDEQMLFFGFEKKEQLEDNSLGKFNKIIS